MTTNDQMQIRIHQAPPNTDVYGLGLMPLNSLAERVEVELPDGTLLYGVVLSESVEIDGHVRVVTKTIRAYGIEPGGAR